MREALMSGSAVLKESADDDLAQFCQLVKEFGCSGVRSDASDM